VLVCFLIFSVNPFTAQGQYYSTGNDASGIKWNSLEYPHFKLIYPRAHDSVALDMAGFIQNNLHRIGASLNHVPRRFPIINHPYSSTSNGFAIWAPRRIELYPRPPQYGLAENYQDHLLVHEIRHIIQMDKLNQGITKAASWFLGDQAVAAVVGLHMANWLTEGDAVLTETLLSHSGRGRSALFFEPLRALWLAGGGATYDQVLFGSYKYYLPSYYAVGYHMVSMGRLLGGSYLWSGAIDQMAQKPLRVANLSRYLRNEIGMHKIDLFGHTRDWFTKYWESDPSPNLNQPHPVWENTETDFQQFIKYYPLSDSRAISLRKSLGQIPAFVYLLPNGKMKTITHPGYISSGDYSVVKDRIIWAEHIPDTRWENQSFSDLYSYSITTKTKQRLSKKQRYFSPALSPVDDRIVCVEILPGKGSQLTILQAHSGERISSIPAPPGCTYQHPSYDFEGSIWTFLVGRTGKQLCSISADDHYINEVFDFGHAEVYQPIRVNNEILFIGPSGSRNALYAFDLTDLSFSLVATDSAGINYITANDSDVFASVYRNNGYKPVKIDLNQDRIQIINIPDVEEAITPLISRAPDEEPLTADFARPSTRPSKFRKGLNLFKIHSWAPVSLNPTTYDVKPGIMVLSQNELSSLSATTGVEYDYNKRTFELFAEARYTGWYPKISLSGRTYRNQDDLILKPGDTLNQVAYRYKQGGAQIVLPFNWTSGRWYRGLLSSLTASYSVYTGNHPIHKYNFNRDYFALSLGLKPYIYSRMSHRDLYPGLGFVGTIAATLVSSDLAGNGQTYLAGSVQGYLPGIGANHSTRLYVGAYLANEWPLPGQNPLELPRGLYQNFSKYRLSTKLDYAMPLWYPDWSLSSILYVKRIKTNMFVDMARSNLPGQEWFLSTGLDLRADFFFIRIGAEMDGGLRTLYNPILNDWTFELLYNFNLE